MDEKNQINIKDIEVLDTSLFKGNMNLLYYDLRDNYTSKVSGKNVVNEVYLNSLTDEQKTDIKNIMKESLDDVDSINNVIRILNKGNLNNDYNCFFIFKHYKDISSKPKNNEGFIHFKKQIIKAQKFFSNYF